MLISFGAALDRLVTDRSEPLSLFLPSLVASDEWTDAVGGVETDGLGVQLGENENVDAPGLVETESLEDFSDPVPFYKLLHNNIIGEVM